jgi:hypothetical protein
MAKHQHLSHYQQGIVKRYYRNLDGITLGRLQELVSELALAGTDAKARDKLWKRVETALAKADVDRARVDRVLASKDAAALARLVAELAR